MVNLILIILFAVVLLLSFLEDYLKPAAKSWILVILGSVMVILAATKDPLTTADGDVYDKLFYNNDDPLVVLATEPTFIWLSRIIQFFGGGLACIFVIYALMTIPLRLTVLNQLTPFVFTALLIYIPVYFEVQDMVQIRSAAALAFVMLSLKPIVDRRYLVAFGLIIIATLLHYSCALFIPFIFLGNVRLGVITRIVLASCVPIGFLMYFLNLDLFSLIPSFLIRGKIEFYIDSAKLGLQADPMFPHKNIFLLSKCLLLFVVLFYYEYLRKKNRYIGLFTLMLAAGLFFNLSMTTVPVVSVRIFDLFGGVADAFLFSYLLYIIRPRYVARILIATVGIYVLVYNMVMGIYFW